MRTKTVSFLRGVFKGQSGQSIMWVAGLMLGLCGVAGLTIDVGHGYVVRNQLQNTVNSAGLAAAGYIYDNATGTLTTAESVANTYITDNPINNATTVSGYPTTILVCRNAVQTVGWTCTTNPINNALVITDKVTLPTTFLRLFGIKSFTMSAQATASMASTQLWNLAVIEDLTGSMSSVDSNCASMTDFACTLNGLQGFLIKAYPCPPGASSCTPANANLRMAMFGFPNLLIGALPVANACSGTSYVTPQPFQVLTLPSPTATSYVPLTYQYTYKLTSTSSTTKTFTASYEMTYGAGDADANGFVSDYYQPSNTATGGLNPASSLVQGIGYTGTGKKTGCMLLDPDENSINGAVTPPAAGGPGVVGGSSADDHNVGVIVNTTQVGEGTTYLASVIYAANSALIAEKNLMTSKGVTTQNAIIIQSDGGVNTQWIYFPQGLVTQNPPATHQPTTAPWNGNFAGYNAPSPAKIPVGNICSGTPGTAGTLACPGEYDTLNTTPQTPSAYPTAKIAANLSSPLAMAVGGVAVANTGLYPDFLDECQQTIAAGMYATSKGTRVYAIAYGASTGNGCSQGTSAHGDDFTDVTLRPLSDYYGQTLNVAFGSLGALSPCVEMQDTASDLQYFYSYYPSGSTGSCVDTNHTSTSIVSIYQSIQATIGKPRLIPNTAN